MKVKTMERVFLHRVCVWNNLIGYEKTIKNWIKDIYGVVL